MKRLSPVLRDAWRLAWPYFRSEEKWSARALLAVTVGFNLVLVGFTVWLSYWNNALFNTLQNKDAAGFVRLFLWGQRGGGFPFGVMPGFLVAIPAWILVYVYYSYFNQLLQIRFRRWSTNRLSARWLAGRAYYVLGLTVDGDDKGSENPDQRIADDLNFFVSYSMSLGLDLLSNVVALFGYAGILWSLSGRIVVFGFAIRGYLVWVALVSAVLANTGIHLIGRQLIPLNFARQKFEANFRFHLAHLREHSEAVALYGGERQEAHALRAHFEAIYGNFLHVIKLTRRLNGFSYFNDQFGNVLSYIVAAPRFFSGALSLGDLSQVASSFGTLQGALSWLAGENTYSNLAYWAASVERLANFERAIEGVCDSGFERELGEAPGIADGVMGLPDGRVIAEGVNLEFAPGQHVVIQGASGSGKSTLFRVLAGIWPFGEGQVTAPMGKPLFLPQRPYFPLGTLRAALAYPAGPEKFGDAALVEALRDVGLGELAGELDDSANWSQRLSGGEQQRLALARALLNKPEWLFLDEATSALDAEAERVLLESLSAKLPHATRIAVSHGAWKAERIVRLEKGRLSEV